MAFHKSFQLFVLLCSSSILAVQTANALEQALPFTPGMLSDRITLEWVSFLNVGGNKAGHSILQWWNTIRLQNSVKRAFTAFTTCCASVITYTSSPEEDLGQEDKPVLHKTSPNIQTNVAAHAKQFLPNFIFTSTVILQLPGNRWN